MNAKKAKKETQQLENQTQSSLNNIVHIMS